MHVESDPRLVDSGSRYSLPFPLAALYAKSRTAHDPGARYGFSFRLLEGIVRFVGFVGLSDAASRGAPIPRIDRWMKTLEMAGLGKLASLAKDTTLWLGQNGGAFLAEAGALWGGSWEAALERLIARRNRFAHDEVAVPSGEAIPLLNELQPDLLEILSGVQFLRKYSLGTFRSHPRKGAGFRSSWYPCRGLEEAGQFVAVETKEPPRDDVPVLFDSGFEHGVYLDPFVIWAPSATDGAERLFWLQRTDQGVARYAHPVLRHEPVAEGDAGEGASHGRPLPAVERWAGRCEVRLDDASRKALGGPAPFFPPDGRFRLLGKIGEGAMGSVYEAHDTVLDQRRALKFIRPELMRSPDAVRRLQREARLLASLNSPAVVRVFDIDLSADPAFFVMELLQGEDLGAFIGRSGPVPPLQAVQILGEICKAISAVHELGAVHRDVKPSNIMLGADGVRLLDFGIALTDQGTRYSASVDRMGTPFFMAPEQWEGRSSPASDIFAAGRVLAAMMLGRTPPMGDAVGAALAGSSKDCGRSFSRPRPRTRRKGTRRPSPSRRLQGDPYPPSPLMTGSFSCLLRPAVPPLQPLPPPLLRPNRHEPPGLDRPGRIGRLTLRPRDGDERRAMEEFAELWEPVRKVARELGWRPNAGSIIELYLERNERSVASQVFVSPYRPERFLFRVTPRPGHEPAVREALALATARLPVPTKLLSSTLQRAAGPVQSVDVVTTWQAVVGTDSPSDATVSNRLRTFVEPLVRAIPMS